MKKIVMAGVVLAAVAGCRGAVPEAPRVSLGSHAQILASLGNAYLWNCQFQSKWGNPDWRFVLQQGRSSDRFDVNVYQAGEPTRQIENIRSDGAALIYFLQDGSNILIASDGEARGEGEHGSKGHEYNSGRCVKGAQPA